MGSPLSKLGLIRVPQDHDENRCRVVERLCQSANMGTRAFFLHDAAGRDAVLDDFAFAVKYNVQEEDYAFFLRVKEDLYPLRYSCTDTTATFETFDQAIACTLTLCTGWIFDRKPPTRADPDHLFSGYLKHVEYCVLAATHEVYLMLTCANP